MTETPDANALVSEIAHTEALLEVQPLGTDRHGPGRAAADSRRTPRPSPGRRGAHLQRELTAI